MDAPPRDLRVFMDQNNKCNLRCTMCGFSDPRVPSLKKHDMPAWLYAKVAEQLFPRASYLALSCLTEPLMTRDFGERLAVLGRHRDALSEVVTNGVLLTEPLVEAMIAAPLRRLAISLDGASAQTYEAIRVGARFETVVGKVRMVSRVRNAARASLPRLRLNHVLSEMNVDEFPAFLDLVESLGAEGIDVRTAAPYSDAVYKGTTDPAFYEKVRTARDLLDAFCERTGIENLGILRWQPGRIELFDPSGERQTCRRPWESLGIHANGDVVPCMSWTREPFGNLAREDFDAIWDGPVLGALRKEFDATRPGVDCENCVIKRASRTEEDDDFFYRMLAKEAAPTASASGRPSRS